MKLILVENEKEVQVFHGKFHKSKEFKWIVLAPFAIPELEELNIEYDVIDNYYDAKELWNATGWHSYRRVDELVKFVDDFIKCNMREFKNEKLDVLNCYKHQLVILFDGIIGRILVLESLLKKLKPLQVNICKRNPQPFLGCGYLFNQNDTFWANCLSLVGWECQVNFVPLKEMIAKDLPGRKVVLKGLIKKNPIFSKLIKEYRSLQRFGPPNYIKSRFSEKRILLLFPEYEWLHTIPVFLENGFYIETESVLDLKNTKPENRLSSEALSLINNLVGKDRFRERFFHGNVDFYPLLKSRIEKMIYEGITKGLAVYNKSKEYIQNYHPRAVLFSVAPYPEYWFLLQSYKECRIPTICWQHGAEGFCDNRGSPETELLYTDYFFSYGKGATETYSRYENEYDFQRFSIGSLTVDKSASTEKSGDYILYATVNYCQNSHYFGVFHTYLDIQMYFTQKIILNYLEILKDERVIFKLHPSLSCRVPPLSFTNSNIRIVRNEKSFNELLPNAKIIVLDCPSTILIQAAARKKPILVLTSFVRFKPQALDLLRKRAVCAESPEELVGKLNDYLRKGQYPADVNNREFLTKFATHLDDGKSAERAVNRVLEIIQRERV